MGRKFYVKIPFFLKVTKMHKFYENPYLKEFETEVLNFFKNEDGFFYTFYDTIFYPEGGGQECDRGFIGDVEVSYVFEKDGEVWHKVDGEIGGDVVKMTIDWERRYSLMKNHTAQHLISAIFENDYGVKTLSAHMGEDYFTVELSTDEISQKIIEDVEIKAFKYISKSFPVKKYVLDYKEAKKLPLRKEGDFEGKVRVVEIEGIDYSLCKGLHVNNLSEIGLIFNFKRDKVRKNIRLYFKSGEKGLNYLFNLRRSVKEIVNRGNVSEDKMVELFFKNVEENKKLKKNFSKLEKEFCENYLKKLLKEKESEIILEKLTHISEKGLRFLAGELKKKKRIGIITNLNKIFVFLNDENIREFETFLERNGFKMWGRNGIFEGDVKGERGIVAIESFFKH